MVREFLLESIEIDAIRVCKHQEATGSDSLTNQGLAKAAFERLQSDGSLLTSLFAKVSRG